MDEADKRLGKPQNHTQTVIVLLSRARVDLSEGLDDHYEDVNDKVGLGGESSLLD